MQCCPCAGVQPVCEAGQISMTVTCAAQAAPPALHCPESPLIILLDSADSSSNMVWVSTLGLNFFHRA